MNHQDYRTHSVLLGAALAGLAGAPSASQAATVFTESTDFGNTLATTTDLTSVWVDFVASGGVAGSLNFSTLDYYDFFSFSAPANTVVSVPFSITTAGSIIYPSVFVYSNTSGQLASVYHGSDLSAGQVFSGNAVFTMPASGVATFGFSHEGGAGAANYTVGATVPEAGTSVMGLAGMAAAALRRRRKNSP